MRLADLEDSKDFRKAIASDEESVPIEYVSRIIAGEHPVKVWREYRGLTQQQLAELVSIAVPYLSQIETGKRTPSLKTTSKLAKALGVDIDDII